MQPLLTVAIPAYNRPGPLQLILDALAREASNQFTVLICDDSSDERVRDLVSQYHDRFFSVHYVRNQANLGFSANVAQLYELTNTPYIWFLCDDDTILDGAVSKIISVLEHYKPTVAIFNCSWEDSYGLEKMAGVNEDRLYENIDKFDSYDVLMRMTFLSILVYKKQNKMIEVIKNSSNYKDNVFIQLSLGLRLLSEDFMLCESSQYILHRNVGYRYGEFYKFMLLDPLKAVFQVTHAFNNKHFTAWAIKSLPDNMLLFLSQKIGLFEFVGSPSIESKILLKKYYGKLSFFINLSRVILNLVPKFLIRFLFFLQLWGLYGFNTGWSKYKKLINRASRDNRETGFTNYK